PLRAGANVRNRGAVVSRTRPPDQPIPDAHRRKCAMKFRSLLVAAFVGVYALLCGCSTPSASASSAAAPVVNTEAGAVRGVREGEANVFRAIPYALPPVGERRWRAPASMPRWSGVREAQTAGAACMQPAMAAGPYNR